MAKKKARTTSTSTSTSIPDKNVDDQMGNVIMEDSFGRFPDDILISILSRLTMKEAAKTSVISHRWMNLWKCTTGSLEFDGSSCFDELRRKKRSIDVERAKYVSWVNQVLGSHRGSSIEELKIAFDLDVSSSSDIDRWIDFAVEKGVQRFELDLKTFWVAAVRRSGWDYTFPYEKFASPLQLNDRIAQSLHFSAICPLTALTLNYVGIVDQVVEHLSSNCPLLKHLCISGSINLVNVKVVSPLHKLEHFEISCVYNVKNLEISATNLLSFTYHGPAINIPFKSLPRLSKVSIGGSCSVHFISAFHDYSRHISQIEILELGLVEKVLFPLNFPGFSNLKQLELLAVLPISDCSVLFYTTLMKASPLLHRLVVQFVLSNPSGQERSSPIECKFKEFTQHPYKCLKVVELAGFIGCKADTELALYFLKNAKSLDKMIINPHSLPIRGPMWNIVKAKGIQATRKRARQLQTEVPSGVELVIL